jgi:hypothetical protein
MSDRGTPLTGLYSFAAACGLFAAAYGALDLVPSPAMALLLGWGPAIAIASHGMPGVPVAVPVGPWPRSYTGSPWSARVHRRRDAALLPCRMSRYRG